MYFTINQLNMALDTILVKPIEYLLVFLMFQLLVILFIIKFYLCKDAFKTKGVKLTG